MSEIQTTNWSETAASNNAATPDGWPEGQSAASVNNCARETHAAIKREWNRSHATVSSTGSDPAYVLTYTTAPPALVNGMRFTFIASFANLGTTPTVNVNSLGATTIQKNGVAGLQAMSAADIQIGNHIEVEYDSAAGVFVCMSPLAPAAAGFTGGALSSAINEAKGADIASAATCDIGAATGNYVNITGTTTIAAFGTVQAGTRRIVNFRGILTITYNATSMILPGSANKLTAVGDTATMISLGSGNWICTQYQGAGGPAAVTTKTGDYTLAAGDIGGTFIMNSSSAHVFTLPSDATVGNGWTVRIINQGAGVLSITRAGSDTISSGGSTALTTIKLSQGDAGDITSDGVTNGIFWWRGARHYDSGQQTITAGGSLTLAHGLSVQPQDIQIFLHNTSTDLGYSSGDEVQIFAGAQALYADASTTKGVSNVPDATNLNIRYGGNSSSFALLNKGTGTGAGITNSKWAAVFRAWVYN